MNPYPKWWSDIVYFKPHEFNSGKEKHSGAHGMNEEFVRKLDSLRSLYRKPMIVTSGYRSMERHKAIYKELGKEPPMGSMHLYGRAADILVAGKDALHLIGLAYDMGFSVGVSQNGDWGERFIHLDNRENQTMWSY